MKYNGHDYDIVYCDPKKDWRSKAGKFHIDIAMGDEGFYATYEEADKKAKEIIDKFISEVPQTKNEWLSAIENCMVWTGYEECHMDEDMVWDLLTKAGKYLKQDL